MGINSEQAEGRLAGRAVISFARLASGDCENAADPDTPFARFLHALGAASCSCNVICRKTICPDIKSADD